MGFLRKLLSGFSKKQDNSEDFSGDGLYIAPLSESLMRAETAMPGTDALKPILNLVPPPANSEPRSPRDPSRPDDYGPDPIAECSMVFEAEQVFHCHAIGEFLTRDRREQALKPSLYVRTPDGHITYLLGSDTPPEGAALIAAWHLREEEERSPDTLMAAASKLEKWLGKRPEKFRLLPRSRDDIQRQFDDAARILAVPPEEVAVICWAHEQSPPFDGKKVWNTLHSMGFRWGDMDCFQWHDPTGQSDYLIWVEVHDGRYDYALPEEIAAGRQHFNGVRFSLTPAHSPAPRHVLEQMFRAAQCFREHIECTLFYQVDGEPVDSCDDLRYAVEGLVAEFERLNVKPNSSSVCRLR